jgi:tellurium resistance protein TerZ
MTISLKKNVGISLSKAANSTVTSFTLGVGWDAFIKKEKKEGGFFGFGGRKTGNAEKVPMNVDLDASCLLFDDNKNLIDNIYFNQLMSKDGSIKHSGDNLTGDGDGDDEQIVVTLSDIADNVSYIVFTVNAFTSSVNFNNVENAFCRLVNNSNNQEVLRYELDSSGDHDAIIMAALTRKGDDWEVKALGEPSKGRTSFLIAPHVQKLL